MFRFKSQISATPSIFLEAVCLYSLVAISLSDTTRFGLSFKALGSKIQEFAFTASC